MGGRGRIATLLDPPMLPVHLIFLVTGFHHVFIFSSATSYSSSILTFTLYPSNPFPYPWSPPSLLLLLSLLLLSSLLILLISLNLIILVFYVIVVIIICVVIFRIHCSVNISWQVPSHLSLSHLPASYQSSSSS